MFVMNTYIFLLIYALFHTYEENKNQERLFFDIK